MVHRLLARRYGEPWVEHGSGGTCPSEKAASAWATPMSRTLAMAGLDHGCPGNGTRRACVGACEHDYWVGDGICDAGNNNCGCWYDGGDCCGSLGGPKQYAHCGKACACADPTAAKHERMETG